MTVSNNIRERMQNLKGTIKMSGVMIGRKIMGVKALTTGDSVEAIKAEFGKEVPEDVTFRASNSKAVGEVLKGAGFLLTKQVLDSMLVSAIYNFPVDSFNFVMTEAMAKSSMDEKLSNEINRTTLFTYGLICLLEDKEKEIANIKY